jgi:hypothetical protein
LSQTRTMFDNYLKKYATKGTFTFNLSESLEAKCNAPTDKSGIYFIYKIVSGKEILIYIGSSGQKRNGILKTRKSGLGGMKDRLVNGYHPKFGKIKRSKTFPRQMQIEKIHQLKFCWWVTYEGSNADFPTDIETKLRNDYFAEFGNLPDWHK